MYQITVSHTFCAAHALRLPDGEMEPLHGHNWHVDVTVEADDLDAMETVMDFHVLEKSLHGLLDQANNRNLNDLPPFSDGRGGLTVNTSAERVAWWVGDTIGKTLPTHVRMVSVRVSEAPGCVATWRP